MNAARTDAFRRLLVPADALFRSVMPQTSQHLLSLTAATLASYSRSFTSGSNTLLQAEAAVAVVPDTPAAAGTEAADRASGYSLTPREVVELLNRHIVGQVDAKKAVANALRNRWRRRRVPSPMKEDIVPKNILMIGPTGCGKTEIARRLAKLADAPFVKVEATKFTEVGFHGRDVDQIIRDLVDNAIVMTKLKMRKVLRDQIDQAVQERIIAGLLGENPENISADTFRDMYRRGDLDATEVELEVPTQRPGGVIGGFDSQSGVALQDVVFRFQTFEKNMGMKSRGERKKMKVSEARTSLEEYETERLINSETVTREAIQAVEQDGIVFIDEIDKIVTGSDYRYGADASSEGVQRDLLPIIEGSVVSTKYGNVNTDHILFICSGAFHQCKPSDMLAELQGRLPVRVELKGLSKDDFYRILTEPEVNMVKQQQLLLSTEGVNLHFTEAAIVEIARVAEEVNRSIDNIGARRLHTILERIVEDISFNAPELAADAKSQGQDMHQIVIDKEDVVKRVGDLMKKQDLSKYVL